MIHVKQLPFPLTESDGGVWAWDERNEVLVGIAPAHTDLYVNPGGVNSADAETTLNAPTLLGTPSGDFQFSARVTVDFRSTFDAGVLLLWTDEGNFGKCCFEISPAGEPMVCSVVTRGVSDDANSCAVSERSVWLRISRQGPVYAYHASTDGTTWAMVRVFTLGHDVTSHKVGFEVQSPTGVGCTVTFDELGFRERGLLDLRDGS